MGRYDPDSRILYVLFTNPEKEFTAKEIRSILWRDYHLISNGWQISRKIKAFDLDELNGGRIVITKFDSTTRKNAGCDQTYKYTTTPHPTQSCSWHEQGNGRPSICQERAGEGKTSPNPLYTHFTDP